MADGNAVTAEGRFVSRGLTGRADLLRVLAVSTPDHVALDFDPTHWFGYVREESGPERESVGLISLAASAPAGVSEARPLPLRIPYLHAVVDRHPRPRSSSEQKFDAEPGQPLDDESARPRSPIRLVDFEDLIPNARLVPALRRFLSTARPGAIDVDRLASAVAHYEFPRHVPRRSRARWHPSLVVVFEICDRLRPYREDMHRLAETLLKHCGRSGVSLRIFNHGANGPWSDWIVEQDRDRDGWPPSIPWTMPTPGTPVLIVSDLGLLHGADSRSCTEWREFVQSLRRAHVRPLALAPLGVGQLDRELAGAIPILRWSPDAPMRRAQAHAVPDERPEGLYDLLALIAVARRVDPPLLRALRRELPFGDRNAGLEGAVWCHPDIDAAATAQMRTDALPSHLSRFRQLPARLQEREHELCRQHHAHLRAALDHAETLAWSSNAVDEARIGTAGIERDEIVRAREFFRRLFATLIDSAGPGASAAWWAVAEDFVRRSDPALAARERTVLQPILEAVVIHARSRGGSVNVPDWADPKDLVEIARLDRRQTRCWLVEDPQRGALLLQARPAQRGQIAIGQELAIDARGVIVTVEQPTGRQTAWIEFVESERVLASLSGTTTVYLRTPHEELTVGPVERPRSIAGWGRDAEGRLRVQMPELMGRRATFSGASIGPFVPTGSSAGMVWRVQSHATVVQAESAYGFAYGLDATFGGFAEIELVAPHGPVKQRLRWIEPGEFWMGSRQGAAERNEDEGPRHRVTISRGFWLADTACTQALWRAVMGGNPSRFEGDKLPVENVSWNDVQEFLRKLGERLPGCRATLPTEAEWEYACRAGTETAFSFGDQITPEQVNYNGNYPHAGGRKGQYREETVPVGRFRANAWGLHEMHGNVLEWCADGKRDYDDEPQRDPLAPAGDAAARVVRGGSWFHGARWVRSACRYAFLPDFRIVYLGFRFSLRSIESGPSASEPGGRRAKPGTGGAPRPPTR